MTGGGQGSDEVTSPALDGVLDPLLSRAGQGDQAAFTTLYDLVASRVYGLVQRVVRDADLAGQVSAEVFVEIWSTASRFRPGGGALAWLLALAHRIAVAHVRSTRRQLRPHAGHHTAGTGPHRDLALGLSYYDAYTVTDVARALGVTVDVAHQRLRTALTAPQQGPAVA